MKIGWITGVVVIAGVLPGWADAAGQKKPAPPVAVSNPTSIPQRGKKVIALAPVERAKIQMPDESWRNFGRDFEDILRQKLISSDRYVVADGEKEIEPFSQSLRIFGQPEGVPEVVWPSSYTPAATVRIAVKTLAFITGSRGDRMFYGFDERLRTPFNGGGDNSIPNEFPLKSVSFEPNWFDREFDAKGWADELDSRVGLDLGQGFQLNVLFAWLQFKYAQYQSFLDLEVDLDAPLSGRSKVRHRISVRGKGFYYDLAGAYSGYSLGIQVARTDAMLQALKKAIESTYDVLDHDMKDLPLTGKVDGIKFSDGIFYLGTGRHAAIPVGTLYEVVDAPGVVLQVVQVAKSGSVAKLLRGDAQRVAVGMFVRESLPSASQGVHRTLAGLSVVGDFAGVVESKDHAVDLPWSNLQKAQFKKGELPEESRMEAIWKSVTQTALLAYRVFRYYQYDRAYRERPDLSHGPGIQADQLGWGKQIGLDQVGQMVDRGGRSPIVAIIGSGVDYNHPAIHSALWLNPSPVTDSRGGRDRYGWDFVSGDDHPMDDAYPGTQVASLVLAVAPHAKIMPLKAVNPWGITNSAALYASFVYAVDHGAQIILCPWATRVKSKAIEMGVRYAQMRGVLVVAAAGNRGDEVSQVRAYPAAYSEANDHVLSVTSVDSDDHLVEEYGKYANYDAELVQIAAPGLKIRVAEPRGRWRKETSTRLAAALVAGALAREAAADLDAPMMVLKHRILDQADRVLGLEGKVQQGRRLRVLR